MNQDIRWKQRFQNFERAFKLLLETKSLKMEELSLLEKEGMIQRFEFTLELAWKTLKDKMEADGWQPDIVSPKVVLKEAYRAKYIEHIEVWLKMLEDRNLLSHTYNFETFEDVLTSVQSTYIAVLQQMYILLNRLNDA